MEEQLEQQQQVINETNVTDLQEEKKKRGNPADIDANIVKEVYFTAADGILGASISTDDISTIINTEHTLLMFCVLTLCNGFTVTGESACASPENFDAEIGRKIARQNAVAKVWPLMGYALRSQLAEAK